MNNYWLNKEDNENQKCSECIEGIKTGQQCLYHGPLSEGPYNSSEHEPQLEIDNSQCMMEDINTGGVTIYYDEKDECCDKICCEKAVFEYTDSHSSLDKVAHDEAMGCPPAACDEGGQYAFTDKIINKCPPPASDLKYLRSTKIGPFEFRDAGALGVDIFFENERLGWLNQKGETELFHWIKAKIDGFQYYQQLKSGYGVSLRMKDECDVKGDVKPLGLDDAEVCFDITDENKIKFYSSEGHQIELNNSVNNTEVFIEKLQKEFSKKKNEEFLDR